MAQNTSSRRSAFNRAGQCAARLALAAVGVSRAVCEEMERRVLLSGITFTPPVAIDVMGHNPQSVAEAPVRAGSSTHVIVTANRSTSNVTVLVYTAAGTFPTSSVNYSVVRYPGAVVMADVNGDGNADIVVVTQSLYACVLLGNGDGTFKPEQITALSGEVSTGPQCIGVADFNGDGKQDLVVAGSYSDQISIYPGNNDGTFAPAHNFDLYAGSLTGNNDAYGLAVGDLNGDGKPDVAAVDTDTNQLITLINTGGNGTFAFSAPHIYATGNNPTSVAIADLNGDKNPDVVVANQLSNSVWVFLGNSDGSLKAPTAYPAGAYPFSIAVSDLNGDGSPDVIVTGPGYYDFGSSTYRQHDYSIHVLQTNSDGSLQAPQVINLGSPNGARQVIAADLNGDGKPDLIAAIANPNNLNADDINVLINTTAPSTTAAQYGNVVVGTGTSGADSGAITYSGGDIIVTLDGTATSFPASSVHGISINLGAGNDSLNIAADVTIPVTVKGGAGNDTIVGGAPGSVLKGNAGGDFLVPGGPGVTVRGGPGDNTMFGKGDDNLIGGPDEDTFIDGGTSGDIINGEGGINFATNNLKTTMANIFQLIDPPTAPTAAPALVAAPVDAATVTDSLSAGILKIIGTALNDTISVSSDGTNIDITANGVVMTPVPLGGLLGIKIKGKGGNNILTVDSSIAIETTLVGGAGNDSLTGGGGDNVLIGNAGNDTLVGGAGENLLVPGAFLAYSGGPTGNDSLVGGSGTSIADFSYRTDPLTLSNNGLATSGGAGETTTIASSVTVIWGGTGNDTITGTVAGEFLSGGHGADSIQSGGASDLIFGGKNKDTVAVAAEPVALYLFDNKADEYSGITNAAEDILELDSIDTLI